LRTRGIAAAALVAAASLVVPAVAGAGVNPSVSFAPNKKITDSTSSNWSGYAAFNSRYTQVSASWTQPFANCGPTNTWSSFWVGLDGYNSNSVEQTGTSADCSSGIPQYYAWYEMYPKFPKNLNLAIAPGDSISASVTTNGNGQFTLTIADANTGQSYTTTQRYKAAQLSSAEVIAEAPSSSGGVLPLTNFGTVSFSAATANGQPIGSFSPDKIDMVSNGVTKASTSSLSGGTSFSVTWKHS
jgi:hypothetical protein